MLDIRSIWILVTLAALALWLVYYARRLVYLVHMAQQTSYRPERYWRWLKGRLGQEFGGVAVIAPALAAVTAIVWTVTVDVRWYCLNVAAALLANLMWRRPPVKKALVWTDRTKRLYAAALLSWVILALPALLSLFVVLTPPYGWLIAWTALLGWLLPFAMLLATAWRQPFENARNQRFVDDAARMLREMPGLTRVGITGSYGKTSSKMLLGRVLSEARYTLVTPDSYNTPMGITLTVRNNLKPIHQVFVAEMGARQRGDIKELCDIVQPQIGIVTAIGPQHLETFKTVDAVADTKSELIDSLPEDGLAVLNIDDAMIAARVDKVRVPVATYGIDNTEADYTAGDIVFSPQGMDFVVRTADGREQPMHTQLLGRHNVYNILAACAVADHLGLSFAEISRAVAQAPPVEHRLVLKRAGGFTIIDDAFNSNPAGSKAAVDVLAAMPGGRKMIITPGMVELGSKQYELNRDFAAYCAEKLDFVVIVGERQSAPLLEGLRSAGLPSERMLVAANLDEAAAFMRGWVRPGDYVLFENDLPDSYL